MTTEEVQALLRLLADLEREELALLMRERMEAERQAGCTDDPMTPARYLYPEVMACGPWALAKAATLAGRW